MKILFLTYSFAPKIGGIESHSLILATELVKAGYEVCLLTTAKSQEQDNYPFRVVRKPGVQELIRWYRWSDLVFENNPVLNLSLPNGWFRRPRITAMHTWMNKPTAGSGWTARFKHWWLSRTDMVIAVSDALRKSIDRAAVVIPNPFQDDLFYHYEGVPRSKTFVFLGRLVSDKGLHIALQAIHSLQQSSSLSVEEKQAFQLTIIGDGPQKMELMSYAQSLGITAQIAFVGPLKGKALARALNEHRFILIPSIWQEPFGMVALEAMACGCIPIASRTGGLPEAVGEAGLLFEKGNSDELAERMACLLRDTALQEELQGNAKKHLSRHRAVQIAGQYIACIEKFRTAQAITSTSTN